MTRRHTIATLIALCALFTTGKAVADAQDGAVLAPGDFRVVAAGGAVSMDEEWTWTIEASFRGGLPFGLEIAAPLALAIEIVGTPSGSGLVLAGGVTDMWVTEDGRFLWTPAAVLSAQVRTAHSASLRAAFDLTGVEEDFDGGDHPAWIRGSVALLIDMGPYLTIAAGFSYQRKLVDEDAPDGIRRPGWVGDARFSIGAVRSSPFEDLPTFAIHTIPWLDIVGMVRADVDSNTETSDLRLLLGLRMNISLLETE